MVRLDLRLLLLASLSECETHGDRLPNRIFFNLNREAEYATPHFLGHLFVFSDGAVDVRCGRTGNRRPNAVARSCFDSDAYGV